MKSKLETAVAYGAAVLIGGALIGVFAAYPPLTPGDWAAWAQAFGTVAAIGLGLWVAQRQHRLDVLRRRAAAMAQRQSRQQSALLLIDAVYQVAEKVKSHADETALDLLHLSLEVEGITAALVSVDHLRFDTQRAIDALLMAQAGSRKAAGAPAARLRPVAGGARPQVGAGEGIRRAGERLRAGLANSSR
jgi:hypothetical protein